MAEFGILVAAMCLLALALGWFRGFWVTGQHLTHWFLGRGDRIYNVRTGRRYVVLEYAYDRDVLRIRRLLRG